MQAHEGMDALVFNLRQEHVVICDFVSTFHQVPPTALLLLACPYHGCCHVVLFCGIAQRGAPACYMHANEMLCICA